MTMQIASIIKKQRGSTRHNGLLQGRSDAGFTLIELLISIAIFLFLAGMVLVNFRGVNKLEAFRNDSKTLASLLRDAQNRALSGVNFAGSFPRGGYGLHITPCGAPPCGYQIFADIVENQRLEAADGLLDVGMLSEFTLVTSVKVLGLAPEERTSVDVSFKPPRPTPFVGWDESSNAAQEAMTVEILLTYTEDAGNQRLITVKGISGQVSEEVR